MKVEDKIVPEQLSLSDTKNGLLSFLASSDEFDVHWSSNEVEEIPDLKLKEAEKFLKTVFSHLKDDESYDILDAGCGDGMHAVTLEKQLKSKVNYVGLDISLEALRIAKGRVKNPSSSFIHGDVSKLPFKDNSFDVVYSYGVLAYTENPRASFKELLRVLRPGGLVGVWMYPKTKTLGFRVFNIVRGICKLTGKPGTNFIANCIVPFLGLLPTSSHLSLRNASWKQCREIVLVNIAPTHLQFYTQEDIKKWFNEEGVKIEDEDLETPISIWGIKQNQS